MKRIQVLSRHTANQIAAGEVVERPASIVKELVENSIDAGSTSVTIEIHGGGIDCIRITDNGSGIIPEDVPTAFLSHATSKISGPDDLGHIETLGFRGEALASIAAVSHLTMNTRTKEAEEGTRIRIEGGEVRECVPTGCPAGTDIEVRSIFYNLPARLKFLKSQRAEAGAISDYVARAIMGNPDVSFHLVSNGRTVYHSAGDGQLRSAIFCIYGGETLPHIKPVDYSDGSFKITGFIGTEKLARPNRQHQSLFVNSRYVRSSQISFGVQRAYETRLMGGKFPFYVLNIGIDYSDVDVNVHPNKMEVRFKDEQGAIRAATISARMALGDPVAPVFEMENKLKPQFASAKVYQPIVQESKEPTKKHIEKVAEETADQRTSDMFAPAKSTYVKMKDSAAAGSCFKSFMPPPIPDFKPVQDTEDTAKHDTVAVLDRKAERTSCEAVVPPEINIEKQASFGAAHYDIIGQVFGCYWIVQQGGELFLIDQHAAHERRLYERIISKPLEPDSQLLLIPQTERLMPQEYNTLMDNIELFRELGFDIEEFGPLTVNIRAVPAILNRPETAAFLHEAIGTLQNRGRLSTTDLKRSALIQASCKHAIKAGALLSKPEIEALLNEYADSGVPVTCPHGRPVMVRMTKLEFEKLFKRVL